MEKLQFLLVEDNEMQQIIAKNRIETAGILTTVTRNDRDAIEKAKNNLFNLIHV